MYFPNTDHNALNKKNCDTKFSTFCEIVYYAIEYFFLIDVHYP